MPGREHPLAAWFALALGIVCIGFSAIFVKLAQRARTGLGVLPGAHRRRGAGALVAGPRPPRRRTAAPGPRRGRPDRPVRSLLRHRHRHVEHQHPAHPGGHRHAAGQQLAPVGGPGLLPPVPGAAFLALLAGAGGGAVGHGLAGGPGRLRHLRLDPGNLLAVGASFFYAAYLLTTHRARAKVDLLTVMTLSTVTSAVLLLGINLAMGTALGGYSRRAWLALAGLGLVSQLTGWLAINYALGHLRAAPVSVCLLSQVLVTALAAMPLLGEYLQSNQVIGGALVLVGIYLVTRSKAEEPIPIPD